MPIAIPNGAVVRATVPGTPMLDSPATISGQRGVNVRRVREPSNIPEGERSVRLHEVDGQQSPASATENDESSEDDDEDMVLDRYGPSSTPTLIIALQRRTTACCAKSVARSFIRHADGMEREDLVAAGWVGTSGSVFWATLRSVEASEALQRHIIHIHLEEGAVVEVFQVLYAYDD